MRTQQSARRPRTLVVAAFTMLLSILGVLGSTMSSADALVGPYVTKHADWGVCTLYIGTVYRADGAAVGGTDVWCPSARGRISVSVALWRYNGSTWQQVGGTGTAVTTGARSASAQTPYPVYTPGCASWDITATVNVDGSQISLDYKTWPYWSAAYPRYYPTRPDIAC